MRYFLATFAVVVGLGVYLLSTRRVENVQPGQVKLRFSFPGDVRSLSVYSRIARRFMEENPDIYVKLEPVVGDFRRIIQRDLVAKIAPDVFFSDDDYFTVFAQDDHYLPLDKLIARDRYPVGTFYRPALESFRYEGTQYGLPFGWGCSLLLYNKAIFREHEIDYDPTQWTWQQFLDTVRRCTDVVEVDGRAVQRYGYMRDNWSHTMCHMWQGGGTILQKAIVCPACDHRTDVDDMVEPGDVPCPRCGKPTDAGRVEWRCVIDSPGCLQGVQFMLSLLPYTPRAVASDASEMSSNQELFVTNRLAVIRGGPYSAQWASEVDIDWGIGYYPAGPGGRWTRFYCDGFVIWDQTPHPQEAWRFLRYLCSDEAQRVLAKEGYHIPTRRTVAESPYFDRPDTPWDESKFAGAIGHVRFQRKIPRWDPVGQIIGRVYGYLMLEEGSPQKVSAAQFLQRCQRQIDREELEAD